MKDLTKGKPSTLILSFALPVFLGNLLQLTYSLADTRIVGSFLKEDALAAVGATSPLSGLIIGFLMGLANMDLPLSPHRNSVPETGKKYENLLRCLL